MVAVILRRDFVYRIKFELSYTLDPAVVGYVKIIITGLDTRLGKPSKIESPRINMEGNKFLVLAKQTETSRVSLSLFEIFIDVSRMRQTFLSSMLIFHDSTFGRFSLGFGTFVSRSTKTSDKINDSIPRNRDGTRFERKKEQRE